MCLDLYSKSLIPSCFQEQEALKVMCPVCERYMMKSSLKVHIGTTHKTGLSTEAPDESLGMRGLGKRAAATKLVLYV